MTFETLDWARLDRLRGLFLGERFEAGPYWRDPDDLAAYDGTFGERIGWKWDAVLRELTQRGWKPSGANALWDWGCGSGVASRRVLAQWPGRFSQLHLSDHSALAVEFSEHRARELAPSLVIHRTDAMTPPHDSYLLCVSHVWNELPAAARENLMAAARHATAVLWVEPGTHASSRAVQQIRANLVGAGLQVVAPCTHQETCGLLKSGNERHWCHHFAEPPPAVFADSEWVRFARRAGVDLRSLPYAFLALDRQPPPAPAANQDPLRRVLGRPEVFKGFARAQFCGATGVDELEVPQRVAGPNYKDWSKQRGGPLYRVATDSSRPQRVARIEAHPTLDEITAAGPLDDRAEG